MWQREDYQEEGYQYKDFNATALYCDNCGHSMPVREKLLLILPNGYLYEYICTGCGKTVGDKRVSLSKKDKGLF
ncbi:MAG: cytoplasmic protein [Candidatus Omnitrophica bacterium]|nr:cytoplasmic protein [Candidatus Omnitrophota bacterium]